jgi:hypothetical protein
VKPNSALLVSDDAENSHPVSPEVRLFRHIILNAVLDAIYGSCLTHENSNRIRAEAVSWFRDAEADFQRICECAGLDPRMVQRDALAYIRRQREALPTKATRPSLNLIRRQAA